MWDLRTRLLIESVRLVFAVLVAWASLTWLQAPIESTCPPSEVNPGQTSAFCAGASGLYAIGLGFLGAVILSVIAEWLWRRRRKRRFANRLVKPS